MIGLVYILVQNKRHAIAWRNGDKGNLASPDLSELNHTDKPNDTTTNWAISFTDTLYLNFAKLCLEHMHLRSSLFSKHNINTFAIISETLLPDWIN